MAGAGLVIAGGPTFAWTNMPAALTFLGGSTFNRWSLDTRGYTEARLMWTQNVVGATGATIVVRYRTSDDTTAANWTLSPRADGTAFGFDVAAAGFKDTGWQTLAAAAIGPAVWFAMLGVDGDGAADPAGNLPTLAFR